MGKTKKNPFLKVMRVFMENPKEKLPIELEFRFLLGRNWKIIVKLTDTFFHPQRIFQTLKSRQLRVLFAYNFLPLRPETSNYDVTRSGSGAVHWISRLSRRPIGTWSRWRHRHDWYSCNYEWRHGSRQTFLRSDQQHQVAYDVWGGYYRETTGDDGCSLRRLDTRWRV